MRRLGLQRAISLEYRKRTEIAVEIVHQLEAEGRFPEAHYAFDNGVLTLELTRLRPSAVRLPDGPPHATVNTSRFQGRATVQGRWTKRFSRRRREGAYSTSGAVPKKPPSEAATFAVTLIQRFGSAANLNIHLHWQVADGVYSAHRRRAGIPRA